MIMTLRVVIICCNLQKNFEREEKATSREKRVAKRKAEKGKKRRKRKKTRDWLVTAYVCQASVDSSRLFSLPM